MQPVRFFCEIFGSNSTGRGKRRVAEKVEDDQESQQLGLSFADLPSHIIGHILLRLPIKSVFICKGVCKSWKALISDPKFAKLHFEHAPVALLRGMDPRRGMDLGRGSRIVQLLEFEPETFENDDDQLYCWEDLLPECNFHFKLENKLMLPLPSARLVVVNSCNGLLCLSNLDRDYFVVFNPITGEFIRLPQATRVDNTDGVRHKEVYCGFGFQPKANEYKVVRILKRHLVRFQENKECMAVEMHTLGTSTWKNVDVDPRDFKWLEFPAVFKGLGFPTCVSGALHWISFYYRTILCFDFEGERFQSFPSPPHLFENRKDTRHITMGELRGSLYICDSSSSPSKSSVVTPFTMGTPFTMWIMMKYGFGESWTKVFSIDPVGRYRWPCGGLCWPVQQFKNGAAMLMYHSDNCFIYHEPEKHRFKLFKVRGTQSSFEVIPHFSNFISLKDAVKGDNIEVLNVHSRCAELKLHGQNEVLFLTKVLNIEVTKLDYISSNDEDSEDEEEQGEEHTS